MRPLASFSHPPGDSRVFAAGHVVLAAADRRSIVGGQIDPTARYRRKIPARNIAFAAAYSWTEDDVARGLVVYSARYRRPGASGDVVLAAADGRILALGIVIPSGGHGGFKLRDVGITAADKGIIVGCVGHAAAHRPEVALHAVGIGVAAVIGGAAAADRGPANAPAGEVIR